MGNQGSLADAPVFGRYTRPRTAIVWGHYAGFYDWKLFPLSAQNRVRLGLSPLKSFNNNCFEEDFARREFPNFLCARVEGLPITGCKTSFGWVLMDRPLAWHVVLKRGRCCVTHKKPSHSPHTRFCVSEICVLGKTWYGHFEARYRRKRQFQPCRETNKCMLLWLATHNTIWW